MSTKIFTADDVAELLLATSTAYKHADDILITLGRFASGRSPTGEAIRCTLKEWASYRNECASTPWDLDNKGDLPAEVGALLRGDRDDDSGHVRRQAQHVLAPSWLFLDSDDGTSGLPLRLRLTELPLAFLMTESFTSRTGDSPIKWHCIIPLATPKTLPSLGLPGVDVRASLTARKLWWKAVCDHIKTLLGVFAGNQKTSRADDTTSDTLARMAYVPHAPVVDGAAKGRQVYWQEGRLFDLDAFLRASGFPELECPLVMIGEGKTPPSKDDAAPESDYTPPETASDAGPTPNETTGTLLLRALGAFDLVGPEIEPGRKYKVKCPWRRNHTPTGEHDPDGYREGDTSVMVWLFDEDGKPGGGWKCSHNGGGITGQCAQSTAADVLRWARKHGCPLPDRPGWGGPPSLPPPPTVPSVPPAIECPPEFPMAPKGGTPPTPPPTRLRRQAPRVEIEITENLAEMRTQAIQALANHPNFFKTEGGLFDLVEEEGFDKNGLPKRPWLRKTSAPFLRTELTTVSQWYIEVRKKDGTCERVPKRPDGEIAGIVTTAGVWPGLRELHGIVTTPVFRKDFTLLQSPGYDEALGVILQKACHVPLISPSPSRTQLTAAKASLLRIVKDFPFAKGTEDLARGVWLAAIFTRLLRFTFRGNIPMFAVSSGAAGSGKGKLIDAAAIITEGEVSWKRTKNCDEAEVERALGAAIKDEVAVAVLDNIPRGTSLKSATLDAYLTSPRFHTREIGTSKNIKATKGGWQDCLWWTTGNNLKTGGDLPRRILRVDIDDLTEDPTTRKPEITNLEGHCEKYRSELLAAALTLLAGFAAARREGWRVELPPFASFEAWSVVREAVVWCGFPDPLLARGREDDDEAGADFGYLMEHLHKVTGGKRMYMGTLAKLLTTDSQSSAPKHAELTNLLVEAGVVVTSSISLGKHLKQFHGQNRKVAGRLHKFVTKQEAGGSAFWLDPL